MDKIICVYGSSSSSIDKKYFEAAAGLGRAMALKGDTLLFGGGMTGLMGATAKGIHESSGKVIGVIPKALNVKGIVYEYCDELIVTEGLRERKAVMDRRSDAFIALPGGYGTLEEVLEIITLKQLKYHNKPVVILNVDGFYDQLIKMFASIIDERFAKPECREFYFVTPQITEALDYIDSYTPHTFGDKWFTDVDAPSR